MVNPQEISLCVTSGNKVKLDVEQVRIIHDSPYPPYEGSTTVTPEVDAQVLPTRNTLMRDDVLVLGIPYSQTSNPQGGYTAIIGG